MYKKILFAALSAVVIFIPLTARAFSFNIWENTTKKTVKYVSGTTAFEVTDNCNVVGPCNLCDALQVFKNIINVLFTISIPIAVAFIVYGGIRVMTSGGSEQNVSEAKNIITSALIGLGIALSAWIIVSVILSVIAQSSFPTKSGEPINFKFWNDITCTIE